MGPENAWWKNGCYEWNSISFGWACCRWACFGCFKKQNWRQRQIIFTLFLKDMLDSYDSHEFEQAPEPESEGEYDVFRINEKVYAITTLPESEGLIEDLYFYVNKEGIEKKFLSTVFNHEYQVQPWGMDTSMLIPVLH